ncbi:MAG: hypothetical protein ACXQTI_03185 [Candidatus Nezhaarchaeales archaeon]
MSKKPQKLRITFLSRDFEVLSLEQTWKSWHSTVCKVDDVVLKIRSFDIKSAGRIKEHIKKLVEAFDFIPDFLGIVIGGIEANGRVKPAVISFHSYAEPISMPTLKDIWEVLGIIVQAQIKGYTLDLKPSNFGKLKGRVVYVDEYGIGKPLPKDIMEDFEKLKEKIEWYFKQIKMTLSGQGASS